MKKNKLSYDRLGLFCNYLCRLNMMFVKNVVFGREIVLWAQKLFSKQLTRPCI